MGLLLFYPTPVFEKEDSMPEDFNQKLEKWIIDYSQTNEEAINWSKKFYGKGVTSYGSDQKLHEKEDLRHTQDSLEHRRRAVCGAILLFLFASNICEEFFACKIRSLLLLINLLHS